MRMQRGKRVPMYVSGRWCSILAICALLMGLLPASLASATTLPAKPEPIVVRYEFPEPVISKAGDYHAVHIKGLPNLNRPGLPRLPIKTAKLLIPFGQEVTQVRVIPGQKASLKGTYRVEPGQQPVPLSRTGSFTPTLPAPEVYGSAQPFPGELHSPAASQGRKGYRLLVLTLYPVEYLPQPGTLGFYESLTVQVSLRSAPWEPDAVKMLRHRPRQWAADRAEARALVDNPAAVAAYPTATRLERVRQGESASSHLLDPGTPYDYVIITNEALMAAPGPHNFQALKADKDARGISTLITTTEWIAVTYDGTRPDGGSDLQTKIRAFISDTYQTWGTEYVLLGGDGDGGDVGGESGDTIVPHRGFASVSGEIDYDIPADMYYACLDGTFDHDSDGRYAEPTDGPGGGEVDLFAEVYVGRAAVDSNAELANFVRKTLAYQADDSAYLRDAWMVGELLWDDPTWGGDYKEEIRTGTSMHGYTTVGFEDSPYASFFNVQTLYDKTYPGNDWPKSEIIAVINSPAHIINHLGHCSNDYAFKMVNSDVDNSLTNDHYFIGYSQGCYAGAFDNRDALPPWGSGDYLTYDCISEHFANEDHGAVVFVSNSRYGWGAHESTDGASQYYDRQFWDAVLGEGIFQVGKANQDSKEDTYGVLGAGGFTWVMRYCYYELNVFGDPELTVKTGSGVTVQDYTVGGDGVVDAGETVDMWVTLFNTEPTAVTNVQASLSTNDAYVTVTQDLQGYGNIASLGTSTSAGPYVFSVDPACPDDHEIAFTLHITATEGTWISSFSVPVRNEPRMTVTPGSLSATLSLGRQVTRTLTVSNTGTALLTFEFKESGGSGPVLAGATVLLVDDDDNIPDVQSYYTAALGDLGVSYDVYDVIAETGSASGDGPPLATMQGYPVIIWFSGDDFGVGSDDAGPNATDEANLGAYLDAGGALFLSSQDYLYDMGLTSFGRNYLHVGSFVSDEGHTVMTGIAGDPIGDGRGPYTLNYPLSNYSDDVHGDGATGSSEAFLGNQENMPTAVDYDSGTFRTVFFGWPWEALQNADSTAGTELLEVILDWLSPMDVAWLAEDPISGTVPADDAVQADVIFDAGQVSDPGVYTARLRVFSNDPTNSVQIVPVTMTVTAGPMPALSIGKVDSPDPVPAGGVVTYTITVHNTGEVSATNVTISDVVPAHAVFRAASDSGIQVGDEVQWTGRTIPDGDSLVLQFSVDVDTPLPQGTILVNDDYGVRCAQGVVAVGAPVTTAVDSAPVLAISKVDSPDPVPAGDVLTYTLTVSNTGDAPATGVVVTDTIPAYTTFHDAEGGGMRVGDQVHWTDQAVNAGDSLVLHFSVTVTAPLTHGIVLTNGDYGVQCAEVVSAAGDAVTTTVTSAPILAITKIDSVDPVSAGDVLTYTLIVYNTGNANATGVVVTDVVPIHTTLRYAAGGMRVGDEVHWTDQAVNAGDSLVLRFSVTVNQFPPKGTTSIVNSDYGVRCAEGVGGTGSPVTTNLYWYKFFLPLVLRQ